MSRTTKILVFLVMLNASAGLLNATAFAEEAGMQVQIGGDSTIDEQREEAKTVATSRSAVDQFVGAIIGVGQTFVSLLEIVAIGPIMLSNLPGVPGAVIGWLTAPLYFIVAFDVFELLTGRTISS